MTWPPRRILIRTRGDRLQGWGHLVRALSLADHLEKRYSPDRLVLLVEGDQTAEELLGGIRHETEVVRPGIGSSEEHAWVKSQETFDLGVMDLLDLQEDRQRLWGSICGRFVVFDELRQSPHACDVAVCAQLIDRPLPPIHEPSTIQLEGTEYFVVPHVEGPVADTSLRPITNDAPYKILVMVGGGAIYPEGYQSYAAALSLVAERIPIEPTYVLGANTPDDLDAELRRYTANAQVLGFVDHPIKIMIDHDLGLFSAGYSKYEAAYAGLPTLMMGVQNHQEPIGKAFEATGAGTYIGRPGEMTPESLAAHIVDVLRSPGRRTTMRNAGRRLIDGRGAQRVFNRLDAM